MELSCALHSHSSWVPGNQFAHLGPAQISVAVKMPGPHPFSEKRHSRSRTKSSRFPAEQTVPTDFPGPTDGLFHAAAKVGPARLQEPIATRDRAQLNRGKGASIQTTMLQADTPTDSHNLWARLNCCHQTRRDPIFPRRSLRQLSPHPPAAAPDLPFPQHPPSGDPSRPSAPLQPRSACAS